MGQRLYFKWINSDLVIVAAKTNQNLDTEGYLY